MMNLETNAYTFLLDLQGKVCAICKRVDNPGHQRFQLDIDPRTHELRGMLCWNCSSALEKMKNDPRLLRRAAAYLDGSISPYASLKE